MPGTQQFIDLGYGDPAPEAFFDLTQEVLGTLGRLDLTVANATTIRALAGPGSEEAGMGLAGALRFMDANVDRAMPGGAAAGRFDVYVTSGPTEIAPGSPPVDTTDYSWDLAIVAHGAAEPGTAYSKLVGYLDWNGAAITRLVQTFGRRDDAPVAAVSPLGSVSAVEAIMPAAATAPPIRAVVGAAEVFRVNADGSVTATGGVSSTTMTVSAAGPAAITVTAADGGMTIGGDVNVYRRAANVLGTDDNIWASLNVSAGVGTAAQTTTGNVGPGGVAGILLNDVVVYRRAAATVGIDAALSLGANLLLRTDVGAIVLGAAGDTNLYRGGANQLRTDSSLVVGGNATVTGTLGVTGASTLASLTVTGNATVGGTLGVTGVLTAPTAAVDTNTTQVATTAFVLAQGSVAGDGAPAMDGAAARGASTHWARADHVHPIDTSRAPLASPALTGLPTAPNAAADTNTTQLATTAFVLGQLSAVAPAMDGVAAVGGSLRFARADHVHPVDTSRAPLASPGLTGVPTAPTAAVDTAGGQLATVGFVLGQAAAAAPLMNGAAAVGASTRYARADHVHPTDTSLAPLASPALTGVPTAPTAAVDTNTTQLATTAYVVGQGYTKAPGAFFLRSPVNSGTTITPSATRTTLVVATLVNAGAANLYWGSVKVGPVGNMPVVASTVIPPTSGGSGGETTLTFMVPPGHSYQINGASQASAAEYTL